MEWREQGILMAVRPHGESAAIIDVFTETRGRHVGIVRGGTGRRLSPVLQPGAQLDLTWRARLEEHLGAFTVEPVLARTGLMSDRAALAGLGAVTALITFTLPERQAYPAFYIQTEALLDRMGSDPHWPAYYIAWEVTLLTTLGFGLDLQSCAVTGTQADLTYVSPRSGRAVNRDAGRDWSDRLLALPPFLRGDAGDASITAADLQDGLRMTGYFLSNWLVPALNKVTLPPARERLERAFSRL